MSANFLDKVIDQFVEGNIINRDDKELYLYGLKQGLIMLANIITMIMIGLIFGMVWQSIVFMVAYLPLRSYAGGYHAKTQIQCYLFSIVLIIAVLFAIKFISWTSLVCFSLAVVAGIIIFILAPLEDSNKPLDDIERAVYKKRTRIILGAEFCMLLVMLILDANQISNCISVSFSAMGSMHLLGKINMP
ncbi:accessory gene regulator ArgB-like protein [Dehalobacterium formicoaceticum]|uniref:Accessory gene regulator B family protein n=1 Tax=Dehalobacterium formicoaceticum TaxID=51515 RepID=A0ABT1Y4Q7_9FIRM|nr:accessory gene regulator B family protein [Dehalobacterium formicoaceticum]MCR6545868.1 accessory gene regulator B family protein [Dehalobacterium formicoaceticum]